MKAAGDVTKQTIWPTIKKKADNRKRLEDDQDNDVSQKKKKKKIEAGIVSKDLKEKMVKSSKQKGKLCIEM